MISMSNAGYPHMVLDDYVARLRELRATRHRCLAGLRSKASVRAYQERCLKAVRRAFSPRPRRRPPRVQVTRSTNLGAYRVEAFLLESRPGFQVSANLYVPEDRPGPFPAVLGVCGHSMDGKACDAYSGFCRQLVANGFIVLIYEPCNQGERDQYVGVPGRECVAGCCAAHNMMGKQMELLGEFYGMWRVWDGMCCLDYLLGREDVDRRHVGVTGNSGGGTMTEWLWAVDERFTMAAPSCFVTTFMRNLQNELPADCEQYPPGVIGAGLEMVDLMIPRAPKPVLLLGQTYDFFDRRGLREAYDELQHVYGLLGAAEAVECFVGPTTHGYSEHNQRAMVSFFCRQCSIDNPVFLDDMPALDPEVLQATPEGNVVLAGSVPVFELLARRGAELARKRPEPSADVLRRALRRRLALPRWEADVAGVPDYRVPRAVRLGGKTFARYAVETEREIRAILKKRLVVPSRSHTLDVEEEVHLYLPHCSVDEDLVDHEWPGELQPEGALYALDPRGFGESMPEPHGSGGFFQPYGMDYMMHGHGLLFGESYCGRRVFDLLRTMELLRHEGAERIHLYGRGQGALLALFATVLHDGVASVTLRNAPLAYGDWVECPLVAWPAANMLRGVLRDFDLPDLYRLISDRLTLIEPWGPDMKPLDEDRVRTRLRNEEVSVATRF